jgi:quercetin dioxygenase-like cupin family protein
MTKQAFATRAGEGEVLNGLGSALRFICPAAKTGHAFSILETALPKGRGPTLHDHPWDEAYYVIEGEVLFQIGETEQMFGPGDFIYAPGGVPHGFQGASDTPARVLVFDAPATVEEFFREIDREVVNLPDDLVKVPELAARHGMRFRPVG